MKWDEAHNFTWSQMRNFDWSQTEKDLQTLYDEYRTSRIPMTPDAAKALAKVSGHYSYWISLTVGEAIDALASDEKVRKAVKGFGRFFLGRFISDAVDKLFELVTH